MEIFYVLLGRLLFPRRQDWEQRKHAKTLVFTLVFALMLGVVMAEAIRLMYYHKK